MSTPFTNYPCGCKHDNELDVWKLCLRHHYFVLSEIAEWREKHKRIVATVKAALDSRPKQEADSRAILSNQEETPE